MSSSFPEDMSTPTGHLYGSSSRRRFSPPAEPRRFWHGGNLKGIYSATRQYAKALSCVERILLLSPEAAGEIRDRALLLGQMQRTEEAILGLTRYLTQSPEPDEAEKVREQLRALRMGQALLN